MKTMAYEAVGHVSIAVFPTTPPGQPDWDAYMAQFRAVVDRYGAERARGIVFTEGGGPSFAQRQQLNTILGGRSVNVAVVTANAFSRGIVVALSVFNPKIRTFRPDATSEAFRYLALSENEGKAVWRAVVKLQAELGLKGARSTGV